MITGVSVIVPTYRRPRLLLRCLDALASACGRLKERGIAAEVVVCDDGAESEVELLVNSHWASSFFRYLKTGKRSGPAAARNRGAREARFELLAFTDDDCIPADDWLTTAVDKFDDSVTAAWGRLEMPIPIPPTDYERNESGLTSAVFVTANCFCRKAAFDSLGGFDENFKTAWREDSDLYFRLLKAGARIVHIEGAVVCHPVRPARFGISLFQQKKQLFDALLYRKHPDLFRKLIRPGTPWHYYTAIAGFLAFVLGAVTGAVLAGAAGFAVWALVTLSFLRNRLDGTSRHPMHVTEMVCTSVLIPFLSVWWRLYGAVRYRVLFA